jgi:peptide/nickel transport system substrate-binding protein
MSYNMHLYSTLLRVDEDGKLQPDLATGWAPQGDNAWRFTLRPGITFHDGSPFTADDVVFTIQRVPNIPNNPSPYTPYIATVTEAVKIDELTVEFRTSRPNPLLPRQIAGLMMVSQKAVEGRQTGDFSTGLAAVGTGPYRYESFIDGNRVTMRANPAYFGTKPEWDRLHFRAIPNDASRSAALLAGDLDLIEGVQSRDAESLKQKPNVVLHVGVPSRVMFLGVNIGGVNAEQLRGANVDVEPLANPLVRKAMSLAINRESMIRNLLDGYGQPVSQIATPGMISFLDDLKPDPFDLAQARKLLAEAGYPNGFSTSLMCTNDRYIADAETCQALSQMLARIGIRITPEAVPGTVYFGKVRAGSNPQPLYLGGWTNSQGDVLTTMAAMFHSFDRTRGLGSANRSGWADEVTDRNIREAQLEPDMNKRLAMQMVAMRRTTEGLVYIPLFTSPLILASRKGIVYRPGTAGSSELTLAMKAHPQR